MTTVAAPAALRTLMEAEPRVATTASGPIEYADAGEGPVVLSLHPALGGFDYGLGMGSFLALNGFRVVAPSRAGYLGSPPLDDNTPEGQADALVDLLDALDIEACGVIGHCAGGVVGYALAARHPERVRALVAVSTPTSTDVGASPAMLRLALRRPVVRLMLTRERKILSESTEAAARSMIGDDSTLSRAGITALAHAAANDPARAAFVEQVWATRTHDSDRRIEGARLDSFESGRFLANPPLDQITCPTLVIHGGAERLGVEHAERAESRIPDAGMHVIADGCHHGLWVNEDYAEQQARVVDWLHARR